jgi:hypothetical protein
MQILSSTDVSLVRIPNRPEGGEPISEILRHGQATGRQVPGVVLEAAAQWNSFTLLFTTDDTPFEEVLHIHLLDAQLNVLDSATVGGMYSTGSFSLLESPEPATLRFRFIGDTDWSVEVLPEPGFRVPLLSEPTGVSRPLGFSRHFVVRGQPKPEHP